MKLEEYREVYASMVLNEEADQRILNGIRKKGGRTMKKKYYKPVWKAGRIAAAAIAVIIAGSAAVYAATEMWNSNVAKETGVSDKPDIRNKMSEDGFSQYTGDNKTGFSVTDEDITVNVIQTLADKYCAIIYFEADFGSKYVTADGSLDFNGTKAEAVNVLPQVVFKCNGKVLDRSLLNGVSEVVNSHKVSYRYNIGSFGREEFPEDAKISMEIDCFTGISDKYNYDTNVLVKGDWTLKWNLSVGTERRIYKINHSVKAMGQDFKLKEFDVSPLSFSILLEEDGWTEEERKKFEKEHKDREGLHFIMNGITTGYSTFKFGGVPHLVMDRNEEGKLFIRQGTQLGKVLDLEEITGISFVNNNVVEYMSFEDCSYTVVK